jgi:protein-tyrosine phosphatase
MSSRFEANAPASSATGLLTPEPPATRPGPEGSRMRPEEILLLGWAAVLPLSVALSQIFLGLFAAAWLLSRRREIHRAPRPWGALLAVVLIFAGEWLACLVTGATNHLGDPIKKHGVLVALPLLALAASERPEIYRRVIGVTAAVAALVGIYAVWQHFTGVDLVRNRILERRDLVFIATGAFNHHLTYGGSVMLAAMAAAGLGAGGRSWRGLPLLLGAPLGLGLLWSYARSAWCGAFVGLALILGARRDRRALVLLAAGMLSVLLVLGLDRSLRERLREGLRPTHAGPPPRVLLLQTSLKMLRTHPLGIGPGRFSELFPIYRVPGEYLSTVHTHSDPMRALLDGGPLTFVGYLLLVPGTAVLAWRALAAERRWRRSGWANAAGAPAVERPHLVAARHDLLLVALGASASMCVAGFFQTYFWDQEDVMLWLLLAAPAVAGLDSFFRRADHESERLVARARQLAGPPAVPEARRILVLCEGNLCRSPFAALLLERALGSRGVAVESAGLGAANGHPAPDFAQEVAAELGVSLAEHRSRMLDRSQVLAADWILVMDLDQRRRLVAFAPEAEGKVELLGRFAPGAGRTPEIPDPMDRDRKTFQRIYGQVAAAVREIESRFTG